MDIHHPSPDERELALDLIADAFGNLRARRPAVREAVLADPDYAAATSLVATTHDGQVIGHLATKRSAIALDGEWLEVVRFGSVCASPAHRRQGVGAALVEAAAALYPEVAAIILNPAADEYVRLFYRSLGFGDARRTIGRQQLRASDVPQAEPLLVRAARPGEAPRLDALYREHYGQRNGTKRRTLAWWDRRIAVEPLLWAEMTPRILVADRAEQALAYAVVTDDDEHRVWELAGQRSAAAALLWHEAGRLAERFTVATDAEDPLWPVVAACRPLDTSPEPSVVMVRAQHINALRATLSTIMTRRGAVLDGDEATADVRVGERRLACHWTELLCLIYDGGVLAERIAAGAVEVKHGDPTEWQPIFPARSATRRMTDAF
mgnify:CR=1 FL=1